MPTDTPSRAAAARFAILGGGPAGLGAAMKLAEGGRREVRVFEAAARVGGTATSFDWRGVWCDYGSHRLHPASDPAILADIQRLLGEELLLRPRHGRILLKNSWIHFPLKPADLIRRLPPLFASRLIFDAATAKLRAPKVETETFKSVMLGGLGATMCESFYFPFMKKLWGLEPDHLAPTLARRRVSGSSLPKLARKILSQLPGLRSPTTGRFYYPRQGFGAICEAIAREARARGAEIELNTRVERVLIENGKARGVLVSNGGVERIVEADHVWSTLPLTTLVRAAGDAAPAHVQAAAKGMRYRGMILVYLALGVDQYTEYDAHYFPELSTPISRLSEPKNYSATRAPSGLTVLCAELPADAGDAYWTMDDRTLGATLYDWLGACGLPTTAPIVDVITRRLPFAYPVYDVGYEANFNAMDEWAGSIENLLTYGRQGLFAHDNTHHALAMAYGAVDCMTAEGAFDRARWAGYREEFETHVVED